MKLFSKIKGLLKRNKQPEPTASIVVTETKRGLTALKEPKSHMAKQWAAILERRRNLGLRTDKETRRVLRSKISRKPRRGRRVAA